MNRWWIKLYLIYAVIMDMIALIVIVGGIFYFMW